MTRARPSRTRAALTKTPSSVSHVCEAAIVDVDPLRIALEPDPSLEDERREPLFRFVCKRRRRAVTVRQLRRVDPEEANAPDAGHIDRVAVEDRRTRTDSDRRGTAGLPVARPAPAPARTYAESARRYPPATSYHRRRQAQQASDHSRKLRNAVDYRLKQTTRVSVISSQANRIPSRPMPLFFVPPNGITSSR